MTMKFLQKIVAKTAKPKFESRNQSKEEALKNIMLKGIEKQLQYIELDLLEERLQTPVRRWYKLTEDKQSYYCFIKYQNRAIPFLDNGNTAYIADSLEEVRDIYRAIKAEMKNNIDFIKHLDSKIKTMKIAKGVASKKG